MTTHPPVAGEPDIGRTGDLHESDNIQDLIVGLAIWLKELEKAGVRFTYEGETIASDAAKVAMQLSAIYRRAN